jgi:putative transposase
MIRWKKFLQSSRLQHIYTPQPTQSHQDRNTHLNRAVFNDWGLYTFVQMLVYKCQLYGKELVFLDEKDTSKMCSRCRNLQPMPLYKRTYRCTECGLVLDRDVNSAINILSRYFARLAPHTQTSEYGVLHVEHGS